VGEIEVAIALPCFTGKSFPEIELVPHVLLIRGVNHTIILLAPAMGYPPFTDAHLLGFVAYLNDLSALAVK